MNVSVVNESLASLGADAVVVGVYAEEKKLRDPAGRVDQAAGGAVRNVLEAEKFQGKIGQVTHIHTNGTPPSRRVVVVGLGRRRDTTAESVRRAASAGVRRARDLGAKNVAIEVLGDRLPAPPARAVGGGRRDPRYVHLRPLQAREDRQARGDAAAVRARRPLPARGDRGRPARPGLRRGHVVRARPDQRAGQRRASHAPGRGGRRDRQGGGLKLQVLERAECKKLGMGLFLGVAAGSEQPPKFIHLSWTAVRPQPQEGRDHRQGHHLRLRAASISRAPRACCA